MRDPPQLSSPQERSLLEEHLAWHTTRQGPPASLAVAACDANIQPAVASDTCSHQPATRRSQPQPSLGAPRPCGGSYTASGAGRGAGAALDAAPTRSDVPATGSETPLPAAGAYRRYTAPHAGPIPIPEGPHSPLAASRTLAQQSSYHRQYRQYTYPQHAHSSRPPSPHMYADSQPHPSRIHSHTHAAQPQSLQQQQHHRTRFAYAQVSYADAVPYRGGAHAPEAHRPLMSPRAAHGPRASLPMSHQLARHLVAMPASAAAVGEMSAYGPRRMLTAEEKEVRRKISHSAIEKRRRERTNSVLRDLQGLIPGLPRSGRIQKLEILEAATEYIRQLKHAGGSSGGGPVQSAVRGHQRRLSGEYFKEVDSPGSVDAQAALKLPAFAYAAGALEPRPANSYLSASEASDSTRDGSGEDTLTNPADMHDPSASPLPSPGDPSSMDVSFLLS